MKERIKVYLNNTKFIFRTNFSGDPSKDKYGNGARRGNIIIPTKEQAIEIRGLGIDVKETRPKDGEEEGFVATYYMPIILNYDSEVGKNNPPQVYLVAGDNNPVPLDEDSVGQIDTNYILNVKATLEIVYLAKYDRYAAYVKTMYVEIDSEDDPWAAEYANR